MHGIAAQIGIGTRGDGCSSSDPIRATQNRSGTWIVARVASLLLLQPEKISAMPEKTLENERSLWEMQGNGKDKLHYSLPLINPHQFATQPHQKYLEGYYFTPFACIRHLCKQIEGWNMFEK